MRQPFLNRSTYKDHLQSFLGFLEYFIRIPARPPNDSPSPEPYWVNGWMPALDGVALYDFTALNKPNYAQRSDPGIPRNSRTEPSLITSSAQRSFLLIHAHGPRSTTYVIKPSDNQ